MQIRMYVYKISENRGNEEKAQICPTLNEKENPSINTNLQETSHTGEKTGQIQGDNEPTEELNSKIRNLEAKLKELDTNYHKLYLEKMVLERELEKYKGVKEEILKNLGGMKDIELNLTTLLTKLVERPKQAQKDQK